MRVFFRLDFSFFSLDLDLVSGLELLEIDESLERGLRILGASLSFSKCLFSLRMSVQLEFPKSISISLGAFVMDMCGK